MPRLLRLFAFLPLPLVVYFLNPALLSLDGSALHCKALYLALGSDKVHLQGDTTYDNRTQVAFSTFGREILPSCVITPSSTDDISRAIKVFNLASKVTPAQIAIRSGGHTTWGRSAHIHAGVSVDLHRLNTVSVNEHRNVTFIGPGQRWHGVYSKLDALGLAVPGGRVSSVGVGGLTTGGGISYYSTRVGFVCDSVLNYEVVLADGSIVNANETSHPGLWLALKGGSNNFGIVTNIAMKTFEQGQMWGGTVFYDGSKFPQLLRTTVDFGTDPEYDEYAHVILSYGYGQGGFAAASNIYYTKPEVDPPALKPWVDIQSQLFNSLRLANLSAFTEEQAVFTPHGKRQTMFTTTLKADYELMHDIWALWNQTTAKFLDAQDITNSLVYQPLPPVMLARSKHTGGNSLGLSDVSETLFVMLLFTSWTDAADDDRIHEAQRALIKQAEDLAKARGKDVGFRYLNYAYEGQDAIKGYGEESLSHLQSMSRKYDPEGFFQKTVPGGFKVF